MPQRSKPTPSDLLFLGTYGHVTAVSKRTGRKVWSTSLPKTGWEVVTLVYEEHALFCATAGRLFALDPSTGEILWKNQLKGLGSGMVFLTTVNSNNTEAVLTLLREAAKRKAAAATAATT